MVHHVRGEKVVFGKEDICVLDAMPSADAHEAMVLAPPRKKSWTRRCFKIFGLLFFLTVLGIGALFVALENGSLDATLTAQAENAMSRALGSDFEPKVASVRLRFTQNWMLALEAGDVRITHVKSGVVVLKTDSIRAALDPVALVQGRLALASAEIGVAEGDLSFLPPSPGIDWGNIRIDSVPVWLEMLYPQLDRAVAQLDRSGTREVSAGSVTLKLPGPKAQVLRLNGFDFTEAEGDQYKLSTALGIGTFNPNIALTLTASDERVTALEATVSHIDTGPFLMRHSKMTGEKRYGLEAPATVTLTATRDKALGLRFKTDHGLFYADGDAQPIKSLTALLNYDFAGRKIEVSEGGIDVTDTMIPFNGALADLDKVKPGLPHGYAFEVVANDAIANVPVADEEPEAFNATTSGYYLSEARELQLDTLGVSTPSGTLAGSLNVKFVEPSPAVNFTARAGELSVTSVKQLWPFWFGSRARNWVLTHIAGGKVKNAEIDVSLAAGRLPEHPEPLLFENGELRISFDAEGLGLKYFGDLPAASNTSGHFNMVDRKLDIDITKGEIQLPSGKILNASDGKFTIEDTAHKPVMAAIAISAEGDASAAAEYASFKPIDVMAKVPFSTTDITGSVKGGVQAVFGLNSSQNPPKPDWDVSLALNDVSLKKPIENRTFSDINGTLKIDTQTASLKGKADIDGMDFDINFSEPVVKDNNGSRSWQAKADLSEAEVLTFAPALASYLSGGVSVAMDSKNGTQHATVSLTDASLSIPFVNWRKGRGIKASAEFAMVARDGQTRITDFTLEGDGFGARGDMVIDKNGLVSGKFSRVKLSPADNFALTLQRKSGGLTINVTGESIDAKPFIESTKSPEGSDPDSVRSSNSVTVKLDRAVGYNKESLSNVNLKLMTAKGRISTLSLTGVTKSNQALVIHKDSDEGAMEITGGDAGAVARFADIYRNMNGGLLNITLRSKDADSWRGSVDVRNFALINEARLKSIVSARTGNDGRSLSDALKTDIDTSSQKFRRGFARLIIDGSVIKIENGVVRGDQLGATFQGTVRDRRNRMDLTGTFMPAYGLNSLFGQLPLIGAILGNGRDRGLLGITFKLEGAFEQPKMTVNPLSLIAPGVFRNIFEFE